MSPPLTDEGEDRRRIVERRRSDGALADWVTAARIESAHLRARVSSLEARAKEHHEDQRADMVGFGLKLDKVMDALLRHAKECDMKPRVIALERWQTRSAVAVATVLVMVGGPKLGAWLGRVFS